MSNINEAGKSDQLIMAWLKDTGTTAETAVGWFVDHVAELAILAGTGVMVVAVALVAFRHLPKSPQVGGMRHARARR